MRWMRFRGARIARREVPVLVRPVDYNGESTLVIAATQRDELSRGQASKLVDEWMDFFAVERPSIREIEFVTRTPRRLFNALAPQRQVERLGVKWGDYEDLGVLDGWTNLHSLSLRGGGAVTSIAPLAQLQSLTSLALEGMRLVHDYDPLGALTSLEQLELGGGGYSDWRAHIDSIGFLSKLTSLKELWIHSAIVDDGDYSPIIGLQRLEVMRVMKSRGMRPSHEELVESLPRLREWQ